MALQGSTQNLFSPAWPTWDLPRKLTHSWPKDQGLQPQQSILSSSAIYWITLPVPTGFSRESEPGLKSNLALQGLGGSPSAEDTFQVLPWKEEGNASPISLNGGENSQQLSGRNHQTSSPDILSPLWPLYEYCPSKESKNCGVLGIHCFIFWLCSLSSYTQRGSLAISRSIMSKCQDVLLNVCCLYI